MDFHLDRLLNLPHVTVFTCYQKEVSVDMWGGFPKVIREVFPNALIVIDRFHVRKLVQKALNKIRLLLEIKGLKNRYLLLRNNRAIFFKNY